MMNKREGTIRNISVILLLLSLSLLTISVPGHDWDMKCWLDWATHIFHYGLPRAYEATGIPNNYLPLYQYVLYGYGQLTGSDAAILHNGYVLRLFTFAIEVLGLWYIYIWNDRKVPFSYILFACLLNFSYTYNSLLWGQTDGISAALVFIALYYVVKNKLVISSLFLLLALNMKLQAIIFLPVWGLVYLYQLIDSKQIKVLFYSLVAMVIAQLLILLPFMLYENGLSELWGITKGLVGQYPKVSLYAFNIWYWLCHIHPVDAKDYELFIAGITYKQFGLMLFFSCSLIVLLPLIIAMKNRILNRHIGRKLQKEHIWLVCALISLFFFFFNTQMHERYAHPALIFIAAYAISSNRWYPYIAFSLAAFLNIEFVMRFLHLDNYYTFIFDARLVAGIYALSIFLLAVDLYRKRSATDLHKEKIPEHIY